MTKLRSVTQASLTSGVGGTTQDFTISGFGTATCWVVTVSHTGDGALIGVGFGTPDGGGGTDSAWAGAAGQHADNVTAVTASDSDAQFEAQALNYLGATITTAILEAVGTQITDGVRLTYTTKPTVAVTVRVDLIQCDNVHVGTVNTINNQVTSAAFQGNVVFVASSGGLAAASGWRPIYGFVTDFGGTIRQCCAMGGFQTTTAPATPTMHVDTGRFLGFTNASLVKSSWSFTAFTGTGFTFADSEGTANIILDFMILEISDRALWAGALQTPTGTGSTTYTDPGFTIGGGWFIPTIVTTANSTRTDATAGSTGFGVFADFEQGCAAVANEDAATPTNTESSVSTTQGLVALADAGGVAYAATIASVTGGFSANFTSANGTAAFFLAFVFENEEIYFSSEDALELLDDPELLRTDYYTSEDALEVSEECHLFLGPLPPAVVTRDPGAGSSARSGMDQGQGARSGMEAGQSR